MVSWYSLGVIGGGSLVRWYNLGVIGGGGGGG